VLRTRQDNTRKEKKTPVPLQNGAAPVDTFELLRKEKLADEGCGQTDIIE
jgi:hypothetical protein